MAGTEKVTEYLGRKGAAFELVSHAETLSSIDEARALGIDAGEVAKVIVVHHAGGLALFALPAGSRTSMGAVHKAVGDAHARFATEDEMARELPDYALGSVPPIAELVRAPLYLDRHLAEHDMVVFAAGTHTDSIKMTVSALRDLGPHEIVEVCHVSSAPDADLPG
jgi:Ala-tRNA(Pro) deacylase